MNTIQRFKLESAEGAATPTKLESHLSAARIGIRRLACWIPLSLVIVTLGFLLEGCAREASAEGNELASGDGSSNSPGDESPPDPVMPPAEDPPAQDPPPEADPVTLQIAWTAPTLSEDGSALTDLSGYRVYQGSSPGQYTVTKDVGQVTSFTTQPLDNGTYYFAVTALDSSGNESGFSGEASAIVE